MDIIGKNISFIGAEDDNLDLFEGQYPIPNGISYNSYLIDDERATVVDAVDIRRCGDWLANLEAALGEGKEPAYLIVQHMEPDHSGSVKALMEKYRGMKAVCTAKAAAMLKNFFEDVDFANRTVTVGDNDTLSTGSHTLRFVTAPMVHWPEVMMTLDESAEVLFTADAFGTFAMSGAGVEGWEKEARRYYANIVGRFGASVQGVLKKLSEKKFSTVAPLHGPVLRDNLAYYLGLYDKWSRYEPETRGVLVAYASVYGGTAEAARRLASLLEAEGAGETVLMDLSRHDVSYAVAEAFRLSKLALCSVTYDGDLFPAMHEFLYHLGRKNLRGRRVGLVENGSWAPVAGRLMSEMLGKMKDITVVGPTVTLHSRMHREDVARLRELAKALASDSTL